MSSSISSASVGVSAFASNSKEDKVFVIDNEKDFRQYGYYQFILETPENIQQLKKICSWERNTHNPLCEHNNNFNYLSTVTNKNCHNDKDIFDIDLSTTDIKYADTIRIWYRQPNSWLYKLYCYNKDDFVKYLAYNGFYEVNHPHLLKKKIKDPQLNIDYPLKLLEDFRNDPRLALPKSEKLKLEESKTLEFLKNEKEDLFLTQELQSKQDAYLAQQLQNEYFGGGGGYVVPAIQRPARPSAMQQQQQYFLALAAAEQKQAKQQQKIYQAWQEIDQIMNTFTGNPDKEGEPELYYKLQRDKSVITENGKKGPTSKLDVENMKFVDMAIHEYDNNVIRGLNSMVSKCNILSETKVSSYNTFLQNVRQYINQIKKRFPKFIESMGTEPGCRDIINAILIESDFASDITYLYECLNNLLKYVQKKYLHDTVTLETQIMIFIKELENIMKFCVGSI